MGCTIEETKNLECLGLASKVHCEATRIYNIIRAVGRGELSADNALHQLVEDYATLHNLGNEIGKIADWIDREGELVSGMRSGKTIETLRQKVRTLCDMISNNQVWRPSEAERLLIADARKAAEEAKPE